VLDVKVGQLPARRDSELIAVDHYPNCHAVERRHRSGDGLGPDRLRASEERSKYHAQDTRASAADKFSPSNLIAEKPPLARMVPLSHRTCQKHDMLSGKQRET
jgi:hypothetical protein